MTLHHLEVRQTSLVLVNARRTLPTQMHGANCKVWWRRNNGLGLFFIVQAMPISSSEGTFTMIFQTILCFLLYGNSLEKALSCFSLTMPTIHKARSIQKSFVEIGVEALNWPTQRPDLNSIEHIWDELERLARPNRTSSVPDLTNALVAEWIKSPQQCSNIQWKAIPGEWRSLQQ